MGEGQVVIASHDEDPEPKSDKVEDRGDRGRNPKPVGVLGLELLLDSLLSLLQIGASIALPRGFEQLEQVVLPVRYYGVSKKNRHEERKDSQQDCRDYDLIHRNPLSQAVRVFAHLRESLRP